MEKANEIRFHYNLRDYQARVLKELEKYSGDNKIHVVAAPGAGKTILALKIAFEYNKPTIILVPTIAIRQQWVDRMLQDFDGVSKDEISTDIRDIRKYTVFTYQALYEIKKEKFVEIIKSNHIGLVVLDEAHHLRNAWWKTLTEAFQEIKGIKVVSLTATPPYDDTTDYAKYIDLCGDIDATITIPELVKQRNLCPHQDFIYFNFPTEEQEVKIKTYRLQALGIVVKLLKNDKFIKALATHSYFIKEKDEKVNKRKVDEMLKNYEVVISMSKILKKRGIPIEHELVKDGPTTVQDYERVLEYVLFGKDEEFDIIEDVIKDLKRELNSIGAIDAKKISLLYNKEVESLISQNIGKMASIKTIVDTEYKNMGERLKLVCVTDFIKDDVEVEEGSEFSQLGVVPIFKRLRKQKPELKMAVLTGTLVVIPTDTITMFKYLCEKRHIKEDSYSISDYGLDFEYSRITFKNISHMVSVITELFEASPISMLIGTIALIGEGWDAPFVNSLIIASGISTYVTSNQLRGRAIRINSKEALKVANIWHLACLERINYNLLKGKDYDRIVKRFNQIEGLAFAKDSIETGIARFDVGKVKNLNYVSKNQEAIKQVKGKYLSEIELNIDNIYLINDLMLQESGKRDEMASRWDKALSNYISINRCDLAKKAILQRTYYVGGIKPTTNATALVLTNVAVFGYLTALGTVVPPALAMAACSGMILGDAIFYRKITNDPTYDSNSVKKIAKAIKYALTQRKYIDKEAEMIITENPESIEIKLSNADTRGQMLFRKMIEEATSRKCDTRYLIIAGKYVFNVPKMFDDNKDQAEFFLRCYNKVNHPLSSRVVFSKNGKGKYDKLKVLLEQDEHVERGDVSSTSVDIKWLTSILGLNDTLSL